MFRCGFGRRRPIGDRIEGGEASEKDSGEMFRWGCTMGVVSEIWGRGGALEKKKDEMIKNKNNGTKQTRDYSKNQLS